MDENNGSYRCIIVVINGFALNCEIIICNIIKKKIQIWKYHNLTTVFENTRSFSFLFVVEKISLHDGPWNATGMNRYNSFWSRP